jgi:hypothetical protein
VYRAIRRTPFEQTVAIKVLRPHMGNPISRDLFARERQALATLQHPAIASIFDGGETPGGLPYLVMEWIDGEAIHAGLPQEQLWPLCLKACEAVQYAHERLVIHGDIKPGNLLVTPDGRLKLLDFGLAGMDAEARFFTPGFASPEQERGERLTARSDVYSLGALLAALLAEFQAPALRAILQKARAADPEERYASAAALHEDLVRWRSDQPVSALPRSWMRDGWLFTRRNRAAVGFTAAAALMLTGASAYSWDQQRKAVAALAIAEQERTRAEQARGLAESAAEEANRQRRLAEQQRAFAEQQRALAEEQQRLAETRSDQVHALATESLREFADAAKAPEFPASARKYMVDQSLAKLRDLTRQAPDRPQLRLSLAEAYMRAGDLQGGAGSGNLGDRAGATRSYRQALDLARPLTLPAAASVRLQLQIRLADLLLVDGQPGQAAAMYASAVREWKTLRVPDNAAGRQLALALMKQATAEMMQGKLDAARAGLKESIEILTPVARAEPRVSLTQRTLISAWSRLAVAERRAQHFDLGLAAISEAVTLCETAMAALPNDTDLRSNAATLYFQQGQMLHDQGRLDAAASALERGQAVAALEMKRDPKDARIARQYLLAATRRTLVLVALGRPSEALAACDELDPLAARLLALPGSPQQAALDAAGVHYNRGDALTALARPEEALAAYARAIAHLTPHASNPDPLVAHTIAECHWKRAQILLAIPRPADALAELESARRFIEPVAPKNGFSRELDKQIRTALEQVRP